jgi:hypothetical protein
MVGNEDVIAVDSRAPMKEAPARAKTAKQPARRPTPRR